MSQAGTIAAAWEGNAAIRKCVRETSELIRRHENEPKQGPCAKNVVNALHNKGFLMPIFENISKPDLKLPSLDFLMQKVEAFCATMKLDENIINAACSLRRLLQLAKARIYKTKPPSPEDQP